MNIITKFQINSANSIDILISDLNDKHNYYYEPTEKLHMFDEVVVVLKNDRQEITLVIDQISEVTTSLKGSLDLTLINKYELPEAINPGELGKYYNLDSFNFETNREKNIPDRTKYSHFWLWSSQEIQTWLYNKDNKIYLEISPSYPWLYSDLDEAKQDKSFVPFDEFMKTYKPIFVHEISQDVARQWIYQCDAILNSMVKCEHREE